MLGFGAIGELALGESGDPAGMLGTGVFTMTGNDVGLYVGRVLEADAGTFTLTGQTSLTARTRAGLNVRSGGGARGLRIRA